MQEKSNAIWAQNVICFESRLVEAHGLSMLLSLQLSFFEVSLERELKYNRRQMTSSSRRASWLIQRNCDIQNYEHIKSANLKTNNIIGKILLVCL